MQQLIVAGGAGFIGSHLCRQLLEDGHKVFCIDNFATGNLQNIQDLQKNKNFEFIQHDVTKPLQIHAPINGIYHMASPASPVDFDRLSLEILRVNAFATDLLLQLAHQKKAWLLFASTSEVYGDPKEHPQSEEYWGNVNPNGPRSCYDESKRFAESLITNFGQRYKTPYALVRIFNTYGPNMRPDDGRVVSNFITQALGKKDLTIYGKGLQTRSFCYVADLVQGLIKASSVLHPRPINLGSNQEFTVLDLAKKILQLTGSKNTIIHKPLPQDDPQLRQPNIKKAIELLKWKPTWSLDDGLKATIEYFKNC
jgi:nucleoside-diphosphate-sugar epimerase